MKYLLRFHGNNGFAKAPQCDVYTQIACLVFWPDMPEQLSEPTDRDNFLYTCPNR